MQKLYVSSLMIEDKVDKPIVVNTLVIYDGNFINNSSNMLDIINSINILWKDNGLKVYDVTNIRDLSNFKVIYEEKKVEYCVLGMV